MANNGLKLPNMKGRLPEGKCLSMDDYLVFVRDNIKHAFNRKSYEKEKRLSAVKKPFFL